MSTDSKDIHQFMKEKVKNKGNDSRQELLFDRETGKLIVKKKGKTTEGDKVVYTGMEFFSVFSAVVWGLPGKKTTFHQSTVTERLDGTF